MDNLATVHLLCIRTTLNAAHHQDRCTAHSALVFFGDVMDHLQFGGSQMFRMGSGTCTAAVVSQARCFCRCRAFHQQLSEVRKCWTCLPVFPSSATSWLVSCFTSGSSSSPPVSGFFPLQGTSSHMQTSAN